MSKQEKLLVKNGARIVCVVGGRKYWRLSGDNKILTQPVAVEHVKRQAGAGVSGGMRLQYHCQDCGTMTEGAKECCPVCGCNFILGFDPVYVITEVNRNTVRDNPTQVIPLTFEVKE